MVVAAALGGPRAWAAQAIDETEAIVQIVTGTQADSLQRQLAARDLYFMRN